MKARLLTASLGIGALGVSAVAAYGQAAAGGPTAIGNQNQQNQQVNTSSQIGTQDKGGPVFRAGSQNKVQFNIAGANTAATQNIVGTAAGGGVLVGNGNQGTTQNDLELQSLTGGRCQVNNIGVAAPTVLTSAICGSVAPPFIVPGSATAQAQDNKQNIAGGAAGNSLIVGTPNQYLLQVQNLPQGTNTKQATGNPSGGPKLVAFNLEAAATTNCQSYAAGAALCTI